jgi:hypothetical protein
MLRQAQYCLLFGYALSGCILLRAQHRAYGSDSNRESNGNVPPDAWLRQYAAYASRGEVTMLLPFFLHMHRAGTGQAPATKKRSLEGVSAVHRFSKMEEPAP